MRWWRRCSGSRLLETRNRQGSWEVTLYALWPRDFIACTGFNDAKRQHLSTINTNSDLSFTTIQQQTYRRKQLMDQADDNSLTALLTKRDQVRFRETVNTCTERRAEKRIQRTAWILSHVLRKTLCEHVNGLCSAGWLNEQSITKHWFQSVRTCPYSWATGLNNGMFVAGVRYTCTSLQMPTIERRVVWFPLQSTNISCKSLATRNIYCIYNVHWRTVWSGEHFKATMVYFACSHGGFACSHARVSQSAEIRLACCNHVAACHSFFGSGF